MNCEKCEDTKCFLDENEYLTACECDPNYFKHDVDLNNIIHSNVCEKCQGTGTVSMTGYELGYSFGEYTCECEKNNKT